MPSAVPPTAFPVPLEAVVFDMDGLLLDTELHYKTAIFGACADLGFAMTDELHLSLIGSPKDLSDLKLLAGFGEAFPLADYYARQSSRFLALCHVELSLRPGAMDLLTYLKEKGIPRAVATSTARPLALDHLRSGKILGLIDTVISRTDVALGKPHPESFLKAASALGVMPSRCLALEDSHNGVRAARAAGMATIMVPDLLPATPEMRSLCVAVAASLSEVLEGLRAAEN